MFHVLNTADSSVTLKALNIYCSADFVENADKVIH